MAGVRGKNSNRGKVGSREPQEKLRLSKAGRTRAVAGAAAHIGLKKSVWLAKKLVSRPAESEISRQEQETAEIAFRALLRLRGTALKIAQALSGEMNLLSNEQVKVFENSQYRVPPLNAVLVRKMIRRELGQDPELIFDEFDIQAFAGASLGQVHKARLSTGEAVAVKIQYPGIDQTIKIDCELAKKLVMPLRNHRLVSRTLDELQSRLLEEVDYQRELENAQYFFKHAQMTGLRIPRVFPEFSSKFVITYALASGEHLQEWLNRKPEPLQRNQVALILINFFTQCVFRHRIVHTDPNPGNYLFDDDGVTVLDFGSVKRLDKASVDLFEMLWNPDYRQKRDELLTMYENCGADLCSADQSERDQFFEQVIAPYCAWAAQLTQVKVFNFGDNNTMSKQGRLILTSQAFHPRLQNFSADFTMLHRTVLGLIQIFERMQAQLPGGIVNAHLRG